MVKRQTWLNIAWVVLIVLWFLFFSSLVLVSRAEAQYEHEFFTGQQFGVSWDESTLALGYYWYIERGDGFIIAQDTTSELQMSVNIQSAGIYIFYCRAWNFKEDGETVQYSEWATSLTHGIVDGVVQPWHIKIKLRPVGPLMLDSDGYPTG